MVLGKFNFTINILEASGEFEIRESDFVVASGFIHIQTSDEQMQWPELKSYEVDQLSTTDVYRELACKGYKYSKSFQGINFASNNGIPDKKKKYLLIHDCNMMLIIILDFVGNCGRITFDGKWTPFIESLLQLHLFKRDTRDYYAIKYLFKLSVYPEKQHKSVSSNSNIIDLSKDCYQCSISEFNENVNLFVNRCILQCLRKHRRD